MTPTPQLHAVATQLREWLASFNAPEAWQPVITYAGDYECLELSDCLLWDTEGQAADELTFDACRAVFQAHVRTMADYMNKLTPKAAMRPCSLCGEPLGAEKDVHSAYADREAMHADLTPGKDAP